MSYCASRYNQWDMKCGDANNPGGIGLTSHGRPCMLNVRPGGTRCNLHGGSNLASKIKAEQMLAQARLPAIETLYRILEQAEAAIPCPTCGYPNNDTDEKRMLIQAASKVLDRTGLGPSQTVEITAQGDGAINLDLLSDVEKGELLGLLAQIREIKSRVRARQLGDGDDRSQLLAATIAANKTDAVQ